MTKAIVTNITDQSVFVTIQNDGSQCETCPQAGGCTICSNPDKQVIIEGRYIPSENDNLPIAVGDEVYIDIRPETRVISSLILFLVPIAALFGSYKLSTLFTQNEPLTIGISLIGLMISVIAVVLLFRTEKMKNKVKPYIYKVQSE
ncbi:MAG: SoxR reducing system RseC family protein [Spirochaetales bacterium]|nr:SoxR reducing system RseC family protein [Spirochaetales bacterium]